MFLGCHRRGGVERLVYEAARRFSLHHSVTVYAHEIEEVGLDRVRKQPISVRAVPRAGQVIEFSRQARKALAARSHEHVISFGVADIGADVLWVNSVHAAWLERRTGVSSDRFRSSPLRRYLPRNQVMLAMERRYFTRSDDVLAVAVSEQVVADLERLYGFPRKRSVVVHNGYDATEFTPAVSSRERVKLRRDLGIPPDAVVVLLVANELSRKGLSVLLEAVAKLHDLAFHVLLVGRADPAPYAGRVAALGLANRFHYGGARSDMARVHAVSDIFVLPTRYEAFCLAIVEALASGLPVVTTDVPGARDLIVDGVNGRLQRDPASSTELAMLLKEAVYEGRYKEWAANAPETVRDHTWDQLLDQGLAAIQEIRS